MSNFILVSKLRVVYRWYFSIRLGKRVPNFSKWLFKKLQNSLVKTKITRKDALRSFFSFSRNDFKKLSLYFSRNFSLAQFHYLYVFDELDNDYKDDHLDYYLLGYCYIQVISRYYFLLWQVLCIGLIRDVWRKHHNIRKKLSYDFFKKSKFLYPYFYRKFFLTDVFYWKPFRKGYMLISYFLKRWFKLFLIKRFKHFYCGKIKTFTVFNLKHYFFNHVSNFLAFTYKEKNLVNEFLDPKAIKDISSSIGVGNKTINDFFSSSDFNGVNSPFYDILNHDTYVIPYFDVWGDFIKVYKPWWRGRRKRLTKRIKWLDSWFVPFLLYKRGSFVNKSFRSFKKRRRFMKKQRLFDWSLYRSLRNPFNVQNRRIKKTKNRSYWFIFFNRYFMMKKKSFSKLYPKMKARLWFKWYKYQSFLDLKKKEELIDYKDSNILKWKASVKFYYDYYNLLFPFNKDLKLIDNIFLWYKKSIFMNWCIHSKSLPKLKKEKINK